MTPIPRGWLITLTIVPLLALACSSGETGGDGNRGSGGANASGGSKGSGNGGNVGSGGTSASGGTPVSTGSGGSSGSKDGGADVAGGIHGSGGTTGGSGGASGTGDMSGTACDSTPGLVWKNANKTYFNSYPAPGSEECIVNSGCLYEGQFAACDGAPKTEAWVMAHNIVAVFPDFSDNGSVVPAGHTDLKLHDLCLKAGSKVIRVTALDTCADTDCGGCCTRNLDKVYPGAGKADLLVDIEKYTATRFGVDDGPIQWADLGPTNTGCN